MNQRAVAESMSEADSATSTHHSPVNHGEIRSPSRVATFVAVPAIP
jgi:hypothetical protein